MTKEELLAKLHEECPGLPTPLIGIEYYVCDDGFAYTADTVTWRNDATSLQLMFQLPWVHIRSEYASGGISLTHSWCLVMSDSTPEIVLELQKIYGP